MLTWVAAASDTRRLAFVYLFVGLVALTVALAAWVVSATPHHATQATVENYKVQLGYTEIRSPIDGRIGLVTYTEGNLVAPSSGKLATIVSQDPVYVLFQASERDVLEYKRKILESRDKNAQVTIRIKLPNGSVYPHSGVNNFLDVQVDPGTDTVAVRAQVPNPEHLLIPGGVVGVFGDFDVDSEKPSIEISGVHHLEKTVNGRPLRRPAWYFDVRVQGDGIADIPTHMVDQAQRLVRAATPGASEAG